MSTNPTFNVTPKARKLKANKFDPKDKAGKKALVAWLWGHPQITHVRNGGTWIQFEIDFGEVVNVVKLTSKFPILVWDDIEGLLHFSEEQFIERYRVTK